MGKWVWKAFRESCLFGIPKDTVFMMDKRLES